MYDELASELNSSSLYNNTGTSLNTTFSHILPSTSTLSSSTISHTSTSLSTTHHDQATSHPLVVIATSSVKKTSSSSIAIALPTPTTSTLRVITVATDAVNKAKEITLPTNSVKIFASTWPELSEGVLHHV